MGGDRSTHAWHVPEQREPGVLYMHGHPGTDYATVTAIEVDGQRFERVRKCKPETIEISYCEDATICSACKAVCDDLDSFYYCPNCGCKVVSADD